MVVISKELLDMFEEVGFDEFKAFNKKYYIFLDFFVSPGYIKKGKTVINWKFEYGSVNLEFNTKKVNDALKIALSFNFNKENVKLNGITLIRIGRIPIILIPDKNKRLDKIYAPKGFKKVLFIYFFDDKLMYNLFDVDLNALWTKLKYSKIFQ